jgi:hypothetical protein
MRALMIAALVFAQPASAQGPSRYAAPAAGSGAAQLEAEEAAAITAARAEIAAMRGLARTPDELRLVAKDASLVAAIAALLPRRAQLRRQLAQYSGAVAQNARMLAMRQLHETQLGFDVQYLQLQNQLQTRERGYTAVSNRLKTGHDTALNAIRNIR